MTRGVERSVEQQIGFTAESLNRVIRYGGTIHRHRLHEVGFRQVNFEGDRVIERDREEFSAVQLCNRSLGFAGSLAATFWVLLITNASTWWTAWMVWLLVRRCSPP